MKKLLTLLLLVSGVALATTTSRLSLNKIDDGTTPWGQAVRDNYDLIDAGVAVLNSTQTFSGSVTLTSATVASLRSTQVLVGTPTYSGTEKLVVNGTAKFFGPSGAVLSLCDQNGANCANLSSGTINGTASTNQLSFGSGANVLTSNANLTWNATSGTVVLGNLTANKFLATDALKDVVSYDLYNGTQTWTGVNTFNSFTASSGTFNSGTLPQLSVMNTNFIGNYYARIALGFNGTPQGYLTQGNASLLCSDLSTTCMQTPMTYDSSAGTPVFAIDARGHVSIGSSSGSKSTATVSGNMLIGSGYPTATNAPTDGLRVQGGVVLDNYTTFGSTTVVGIGAITPSAVNQTWYLSDGANCIHCTSTGTAKGAYACEQAANRTTRCN